MARRSTGPVSRKRRRKTPYFDICERLRAIRVKNRLTQREFAFLLRISISSVKSMEFGDYSPSFDVLRRLREKFDVSYDWIIDGE